MDDNNFMWARKSMKPLEIKSENRCIEERKNSFIYPITLPLGSHDPVPRETSAPLFPREKVESSDAGFWPMPETIQKAHLASYPE